MQLVTNMGTAHLTDPRLHAHLPTERKPAATLTGGRRQQKQIVLLLKLIADDTSSSSATCGHRAGITRLIVGGCPAGPGGADGNISTVMVVDSVDSSITPLLTVVGEHQLYDRTSVR